MTELLCCVQNCTYNEEEKCCRHDIMVDGERASNSSDTCCSSFAEKRDNQASNRGDCCSPNNRIEISCSAENCVYNESTRCKAPHIDVMHSDGADEEQTKCSTFKVR